MGDVSIKRGRFFKLIGPAVSDGGTDALSWIGWAQIGCHSITAGDSSSRKHKLLDNRCSESFIFHPYTGGFLDKPRCFSHAILHLELNTCIYFVICRDFPHSLGRGDRLA